LFPAAKADNKLVLQSRLGLPQDKHVPIICATSRVTFQKGFSMILAIMPLLLKLDIQLVFMGDGSKEYIEPLKKWQKKYPNKLIWLPFDQSLETLIYAGSDIFLLPSMHEPCGINQLIAMRYGCIPVVRAIGGLYDTVVNFNPAFSRGTGFTFRSEDEMVFYTTLVRALESYRYRRDWQNLVRRAMRHSTSWEIPAKKYVELYKEAMKEA